MAKANETRIKVTMADGRYTIIEPRDTRQKYPGVKIYSSSIAQPWVAQMYSPNGEMINGMMITDARREQAIAGAYDQGLKIEEV